jgi:hypothetical protein
MQECIAEKIFHIHGGDRVTYTHLNDDGDEIVFEIDWKQVKQCIGALQNVWFDDRAIHMKGTYGMGSAFGERKFSSWLHSVEYSGKTLTIETGPQPPERCRVSGSSISSIVSESLDASDALTGASGRSPFPITVPSIPPSEHDRADASTQGA